MSNRWTQVPISLTCWRNLQVTALSNIEAKKKFEFLESVSGMMDAHLRYFKQVVAYLYFLTV